MHHLKQHLNGEEDDEANVNIDDDHLYGAELHLVPIDAIRHLQHQHDAAQCNHPIREGTKGLGPHQSEAELAKAVVYVRE